MGYSIKRRLVWPVGKSKLLNAGDRFGILSVIEMIGGRDKKYLCRCDCGTIKSVLGSALRNGDARSCGCGIRRALSARFTRHGHAGKIKTPTYSSWKSMHDRCKKPHHKAYADYGGRGITICERWQKFENFLADMGERPNGTSLDRFPNNDGNYEPGNCRWADKYQQANNRRTTKLIQRGDERLSIAEWARKLGKDPSNFAAMLKRHGVDEGFRRAMTPASDVARL